MKTIFVFLLSLIGASAIGQDSWTVCLGKKMLLNSSAEDAQKNVIKLSSSDLKKNKSFIVNYHEAAPQKGWERTITAYDEKDNELKQEKGKRFTLQPTELKALLEKYQTIKIYTVNSPTDPKMKSQVRLRRIHLCTVTYE